MSRPHEVHAIEAALRLAALGFKIQPGHGVGPNGECSCRLGAQCESIGKHPRPDDNGKAIEPTTDAETLRRHFTRWPFASVRIATGNGLLGLDVDPRNGGDASLAALEAEHGPLPDTVTVQTGGGGRHYYFGCDPGARIGHKAEIAPGVELCHGHALTTPPSRHASGDMYRWAEGRAPEQIELAEAPPWLVALAPPADARTRSAPIGERIPKGQRHTDLVSLAGSLRARGFDAEEIYQTLSTVNVRRCDPQYPDVDVRRIADDFGRKDGGTLDTESKSPPQAARLVDFAHEADLFLSPFGMPYASVEVGEHRETWPLKSAGFRGWLAGRYHAKVGSIPRTQAMQDALGSLVEETAFKGKVAEVHVRVASHGGVLYLDLADAERKVVEMTADGWRIVTDPPVRFRRPKGMLPLPMPERGGSLDDLVRFLNVKAEAMLLVQAWLVSLLQPDGSQPILVAHGEQGSAKSTLAQLVKRVVDPSKAPLRSEPRDPRDLMIAAVNSRVVAYDNLSHLPPALSDALCRLSTGGGLSTRELFTDAEETILEAKRPVILTGIEELATRPDLLDRCILTYLPAIPEDKRRVESAILRDFDAAHPRILGALLDAAVAGLRNLPTVRLDRLPRMADFTLWVAACAPALGFSTEAFLLAYNANRRDANALVLETSPVAGAVLRFVERRPVERGPFEGTAIELLHDLTAAESERTVGSKSWPKSARALTGALRRHAFNLRAAGVAVTFLTRTGSARPIRLERVAEYSTGESSGPSGGGSDDGSDDGHDRTPLEPSGNRHALSHCGFRAADGHDANDDVSPSVSPRGVSR